MKVKEIMYTHIYRVEADLNVYQASLLMDENHIGSVLVEVDGNLEGIMSERDILRRLVARGLNPKQTLVSDIMSTPLITISSEADVEEASSLLTKHHIKRLVVMDDDEIVGIVSARGITKNLRYINATRFVSSHDPAYYRGD